MPSVNRDIDEPAKLSATITDAPGREPEGRRRAPLSDGGRSLDTTAATNRSHQRLLRNERGHILTDYDDSGLSSIDGRARVA